MILIITYSLYPINAHATTAQSNEYNLPFSDDFEGDTLKYVIISNGDINEKRFDPTNGSNSTYYLGGGTSGASIGVFISIPDDATSLVFQFRKYLTYSDTDSYVYLQLPNSKGIDINFKDEKIYPSNGSDTNTYKGDYVLKTWDTYTLSIDLVNAIYDIYKNGSLLASGLAVMAWVGETILL